MILVYNLHDMWLVSIWAHQQGQTNSAVMAWTVRG